MPNPKGNPQNFEPYKSDRDEPLITTISFRATEQMKSEVQQQENPPEFCRQAIQKALDELKNISES